MSSAARNALLERETEVATIAELVQGAAAGDARFLVIEGQAGIGKSQLLAEARRLGHAAEMNVLVARGSELERDFPYGVVRQLFETQIIGTDLRERLLAGAATTAAPIFDAMDGASEDVSFAALHGLYWLTVNLAGEQPLMLAVDDLHWADRPSLRFLAYLASRIEGNRLLIAAGLRPSEPGTDAVLVSEIARDPLCVPIRPAPLSPHGTAALVAQRLGRQAAPEFVDECHRSTAGNPFLLTELLRALQAEGVAPTVDGVTAVGEIGPRAVSRSVLVRLSRLAPEVIGVARAMAILGDGADLVRVAELAGVDATSAADGISRMASAEIVRPDPPLGFVHPLVREAIYLDIGPAERQRLHGQAARLLHAAESPAEYVAAQLLEAARGGEEWVVRVLGEAAHEALARGAPDSAVAYLHRALDEPPPDPARTDALFRLAVAEAHVDGHASTAHLEQAYELATEQAQRDEMAIRLVHLKFFTAPRDALPIAARAAREMASHKVDDARRLEAGRLLIAYVDDQAVPLDDPGFAAAAALPPGEDGVGARMLEAIAAYHGALFDGPSDVAVKLALRAFADGELTRFAPELNNPWLCALDVLIMADRHEALDVLSAGRAVAHRTGSGFMVAGVDGFGSRCLKARGDLEGAYALATTALRVNEAWGAFRTVRGPSLAFLAAVCTERGELAQARGTLASVGDGAAASPWTGIVQHMYFDAVLRLAVAEGDWRQALGISAECEGRFLELNPAFLPWRSLRAEALLGLGSQVEATALAEAEVPRARAWGAPRTVGRALRILGVVTRDLDPIHEAVAVLDGSPARLELAKALADEGTLLRLARHPTEARGPLRRALELAIACGATSLAERVRTELAATGARPRTDAMAGVGALTPSERRVAEAAAAGQTNKDIAQALYVTPKTVEVHLSNAYRKLGIRSRRELTGVLPTTVG